ncbi:MAG: serine/threonine protein kinase [Trueperaceae bacterium]|nr:serine/threonine protein kinase [Trueperaceae bacterium]
MLVFDSVRILSENNHVRVELARANGKFVVIKRLKSHSPFMLERLQREALVLEKLEHEHIVPLIAAKGDMIVYAYAPGVNLADALDAGALPLRRSIKIVDDVLKALSYAHTKGVIHCDVKPGNIIVKGEKALLGDFGFAKDLELTSITQEDVMLGTPNYMAPEQFRGERDDLRSDIYAVGAVLYHLLTGQPPYGRHIIRFLIGDHSVALEPLPQQFSEVAQVVYRALDRNPDRRYRSADEMRFALKAALAPIHS